MNDTCSTSSFAEVAGRVTVSTKRAVLFALVVCCGNCVVVCGRCLSPASSPVSPLVENTGHASRVHLLFLDFAKVNSFHSV